MEAEEVAIKFREAKANVKIKKNIYKSMQQRRFDKQINKDTRDARNN